MAIMAKKELQKMQKDSEQLVDDEKETKLNSMIDISVASNVLCPRTAFIGVVVDTNGVRKNGTAIDLIVWSQKYLLISIGIILDLHREAIPTLFEL